MDREVSVELQKVLSKKGMKFLTSVGVSEIVEANNQLTIKLNDGSEIVSEKPFFQSVVYHNWLVLKISTLN